MGILSKIFGKSASKPYSSERHFMSAEKTADNKSQWAWADKESDINQTLINQLAIVRGRVNYVHKNNGLIDSAVETIAKDVVGDDGPNFQFYSDTNPEFAKRAEAYCKKWFDGPIDISGYHYGVDVLKQIIKEQFINGEYLSIDTQDNTVKDGPRFRVQIVDPRRLDTPARPYHPERMFMGILYDAAGVKPVSFWIRETNPGIRMTWEYKEYSAKNITHVYTLKYAEQRRGYPWLAPVLQTVQDLSDYNREVLEAMRIAARFAAILTAMNEDAQEFEVPEIMSLDVNKVMFTAPPGWDVKQLQPGQPAALYKEYLDERLREICAPLGMSLMTFTKDARRYNYSSARVDLQDYNTTIKSMQKQIERKALRKWLDIVIREGVLSNAIPPMPDDFHYKCIWPKRPHVDPQKEATADKINLENGTTTRTKIAAQNGDDYSEIVEEQKKEQDLREQYGIELIQSAEPATTLEDTDDANQDDD